MKCDFDDLYNGSVMRPYYLNEERFLRLSHPFVLFEHCVELDFRFGINFGTILGIVLGTLLGAITGQF